MIGPKAYIHIDRLKNNLSNIKNQIGNKSLMVVVKADGYGHGAVTIARALKNEDKIIFCVFTIEEALELRNNGISNNIFIFSKMHSSWLEIAYEQDFWINLTSFDDLNEVSNFYAKNKVCPKIHIKFDTGMTRLGFDLNDAEALFNILTRNKDIPIEGIYSHLSTADEGELSFASNQLNKFINVIESGEKNGIYFKYIHCSNSGAIINFPNSLFNTVRVGMLLYGLSPSDEVEINKEYKPVMSFCGPIIFVRKVPAGTPVSYGGKYITSKSTNIAVIQTGFADGFPRAWFRHGYVSYRGNYYKIAGRVCMDQLMVDFEDVNPVIGEEVLFFGENENNNIPLEKIAKEISSTTYVLLVGIQGRTKKIPL
jgi:alanine racemase